MRIGALVALVLLGLAPGCAGEPRTPQSPASEAEPDEPLVAASAEEDPQAGHELDVGMDFGEDADESEEAEEEDRHVPPPTQTYSPARRLNDESKGDAEASESEPADK